MKRFLFFSIALCSLLSLSLHASRYGCRPANGVKQTFLADDRSAAVRKCTKILNESNSKSAELILMGALGSKTVQTIRK